MEPRYPFVLVAVALDRADEIAAFFFELGAAGVEERDEGTLAKGPGEGFVTLVASFADHAEANEAIAALSEAEPDLAPRLDEVVGDAWRDAWKEHFEPFALTPSITVVPPWITYAPTRADEQVLMLEPGRAFGTGLHATTSLVAEMLHERAAVVVGAEVLDVGTGSGILALVALLCGAARAVAIDNDADVIEVVRENAARNDLADRVDASEGTIAAITRRFPVVLANIEARVLGPIAGDLARAVAPSGTLILSGILASEHDAMVARFTEPSHGLTYEATARRGDGGDAWVAIAFQAAK